MVYSQASIEHRFRASYSGIYFRKFKTLFAQTISRQTSTVPYPGILPFPAVGRRHLHTETPLRFTATDAHKHCVVVVRFINIKFVLFFFFSKNVNPTSGTSGE